MKSKKSVARGQASRVIARFGGAYPLARLLGKSPVTIYRWTQPRKAGGTGGFVPASAIEAVFVAAARAKVRFTREDWWPL
jgi:hypothetical protein